MPVCWDTVSLAPVTPLVTDRDDEGESGTTQGHVAAISRLGFSVLESPNQP